MKIKNIFFVITMILFNQQANAGELITLQPCTQLKETFNVNAIEKKIVEEPTPIKVIPENNIFKHISLIDKNFSGKDISGWEFEDCTLVNTNYSGSSAQETSFLRSKLAFVNISSKATILRKIFNFLTNNNFFSKNRIGIKFTKSTIIESDFSGSILIDSEFYQTDIIRSNYKKTISINADFVACQIRDTSFRESILAYADFSGSVLKNVDFRDCILIGSNFEDAVFENINVKGVDFRGVNLSDKQKEYLQDNGAENVDWEDNLL